MIKIVLLGTGNVATHLFNVFQNNENTNIVQVYNRSKKGLISFEKHTSTTSSIAELKEADIYIIAIADDYISKLSEQLKLKQQLVVHTSGAVPIMSLSENNNRGVFYPLQTFTKGKEVDFKTIPICIEAEKKDDFTLLNRLANSISDNVYHINSTQRKTLHIAAVFVNNFVNHLYQKGEEICASQGVSFDILKPLILETAKKVADLSPIKSQTGPAKRNDSMVIAQHLSDLNTSTQQEIYTLLTKSIQETHGNKL